MKRNDIPLLSDLIPFQLYALIQLYDLYLLIVYVVYRPFLFPIIFFATGIRTSLDEGQTKKAQFANQQFLQLKQ